MRQAGDVPDLRLAQITRLKNANDALRRRVAQHDQTIVALTDFKTEALSRLAAQHEEIRHLREALTAAASIDRLPAALPASAHPDRPRGRYGAVQHAGRDQGMSEPDRVTMPGQVWGIAAPTPAGPVFVTSYDGPNLRTLTLVALDPAGTTIWRRAFDGHPGPPRATAAGTVWVSHRSPAGYALTELDADGRVLRSVTPEQQPHEHLGAFVVLPDGFCAA